MRKIEEIYKDYYEIVYKSIRLFIVVYHKYIFKKIGERKYGFS